MFTTFFLIGIGLFVGVAAWFLFIWAVKSGQFDDPEAPKYRMLDDDDVAAKTAETAKKEEKKQTGHHDKLS
ncbi:cbb3-type cytochrome oxidase assembly protein CcoS [Chlorobium ferrooxidans]|uniref:Cytochrome oxidase maturation protein, cbb3-type n=1 Tax=Chlorobium ferrooxidans DSM 13031 TaxID=377431 RepID=Q0YUT1_9CHLB|nr:cbb3-type cytochrome oxidase assembly protein CcoS [Chlorobium ferrooxidans]EAT59955.1 cytochrome oxidase maturation protein, cbb3-type [Chlorobium ferrooxidans DSM 13031]